MNNNIYTKLYRFQEMPRMAHACAIRGTRLCHAWHNPKAHRVSFRSMFLSIVMMLALGSTAAWGQTSPVEMTTDTNGNGTIEDSEKKFYLIQTNAFPSFYIAPQDNDNITTNNILGEYMLWYFLNAGEDNGTQYYYIVNNSTGKYICNTSDRLIKIVSLSDDNKEKCKFKIVVNNQNGTTDFYNINVKASQTYYGLNKQSGSEAITNPIRLTNTQYINDSNSKWKFIPFNGTFTYPTPPFTPSTDSETHYYEIRNIQKQTYYASTDDTPEMVTYISQETERRAWYFKEASFDTWYKYYYIINPSTGGKYMYYNGNVTDGSGQTDAVNVIDYNSANEDRYQFVVVQAARGDWPINKPDARVTCYAIIPKLLIGNLWSSNSIGLVAEASIKDGANIGIINSRGLTNSSNGSHWNFDETDFTTVCGNPVISFNNTTGKATISTTTSWSSIYYTTDGTTPSASIGTLYSEPFALTEQTTIKAIVTKEGYTDSGVTTTTISKVATPTIQDNGQHAISITTTTQGATIYYTIDGTNPTTSSTQYTGPSADFSDKNIKAIAVKDGMINSDVGEGFVSIKCATPVISFNNTTSMVTITCTTEGSTIHYTTNGGTPTASSTEYGGAFSVTSPTTIKAIATHATKDPSYVDTLDISQVATPTIQNNGSNAISITTTTPGATIYYTVDGTDPTTSSNLYSTPLQENVSNVTIKAIAVKDNMINSAVGSGSVQLKCATPVITRVGLTITLSCSMPPDATLYYTIGSGSETLYDNSPISFTIDQLPVAVTAVAKHSNYDDSDPATMTLTKGEGTAESPYLIYGDSDFAEFVTNVNDGTTSSAHYKLCTDVSASGTDAITTAFSGTFDGDSHTITGLTHPLFNTVDGGVVKNVTLQGVSISSSADYVGAIAGIAQGYSRIYNCGILPNDATFPEGTHPTVSGGTCAGGIVGKLDGDSRVINCYSYADVSASTYAAGIVGQNTYASTAEVSGGKYTKLKTAVVNCMFYGNITGGSNQSGVYGGTLITNAANTGISSYNYYRSGSTFSTTNGEPTAYNCSFPADERYLTQVEFHRSLLNSNRELCGWWVGSDVAPSTLTTAEVQAIPKDASLMYKWVVDPNLAPYPILKPFGKYPSIVNGNTGTPWFDRTTANPFEGKQLGTLSVTIKSGASAPDQHLNIPITDMDTLHYDFGYRKVQLPYYNTVFGNPNGATWEEKYAGNYTSQVVTGWKITAVNKDGENDFTADWQYGYNFADRKCTDKDLFSKSGRVFAQGGYYYVPDGVTDITIEAYWGKAIYVRNNGGYYDRVNITKANTGSEFAPAGTRDNNVNGATIQTTTIKETLTATNIDAKKTVYDYALVLVGNVQESVGKNDVVHKTEDTRGFTIMSVDLDFDEEPDYCLEWQLGDNMARQVIAPIRFDFLPVVELGIAGKRHNSTNFFSLGCYRSKGHFEVTETSFIRFGQFEFELKERDEGPIILNGGIYDQYCRGRNGETNQHINYVILGGHIVMPSFTPGAHVNNAALYQTRHCAVNALGGDFTSFYLTGGYNEAIKPYEDSPHCYIDGGRFGTIAAAYKEGIAGDVTWRINHALIGEFYGGGVMSQATGDTYKIVKGSIDVVIDNSIVGKYCGGPKFGDMVSGKTVKTSATGTTFNQFFGAGNGGTNYVQYASTDATGTPAQGNWTNTVNSNYHPGQYRNKDQGYEANYDIEVINTSTGDVDGKVVNRSYYYSAQFATTNTGNVTSELNNCTINTNFYGGGFLGGVNGDVKSTLTDCTVRGFVFGAGYSASAGTVTIYNKGKTPPVANVNTGMIKPQSGGTSTTYHWTHDRGTTGSPITTVDGINYFYTEIPLDNLGTVSGNVELNIEGTTTVGESVYGGGESSDVADETGAKGAVKVNINGGTISHDVYGGGKGQTTVVGGNVEVNIGAKTGDAPSITYTGDGTVNGNVYGGSALGAVNATKGATYKTNPTDIAATAGKTTSVNIYKGTVNGSVFGGGLGQTSLSSIVAQNFGNTTVTVDNNVNADAKVLTAVYGGANENGVVKGNTTVTITGGTVGTAPTGEAPITNVVFGGGFGEPTLVEGSVEVNIGTDGLATSGALVNGNVYGGGAFGSVNASKSGSAPMVFNADKTTHVNLFKGIIDGNVYGGGLGQKASTDPVKPAIEAIVGGNVQVLLDGAQLNCAFTGTGVDLKPVKGQIFGCNNLNGTPKGHVTVHVKRTVGTDKSSAEALAKTRDQRGGKDPYNYDVAAVYGGGNQADYIPTDATLDPAVEGNPAKIAAACAEVLIEGCDLTSIEYVYGGGNAAAVPATDVTILGSYIIDYVFGGGNGKGTGNPGANIGSYNNGNNGASDYGSGKAVTKLVGGHIMYVFGGSNTLGNVRGGTSVSMPEIGDTYSTYNCCTVRDIKEIYGAGNEAEQDGTVTMIVGCVDNMDYVYGGARNAHVKGGVDLVITSGHFKGVFGGNDTAGSIQGPITVTIEETGCDPLVIDNLYLGGNLAAYSIYGYVDDGAGNLTARTKAQYDELTTEQKEAAGLPYTEPELNIVSCTSIGNVFGGGYGSGATMYGSPTVNINMIPGDYAAQIDRDSNGTADNDPTALGTIGNVYGGGEEANVEGSTTVNICTEEYVTVRTHMGAPATNTPTAVQGALVTENVFGAGKGLAADVNSAKVTGNTTVTMAGGSVTKSVYGGGQLSQVDGNTTVIIRGGTIGKEREGASAPYTYYGGAEYGNVYGGGLGNESNVKAGLVTGNTNINIENVLADATWVEAHPTAGKAEGDVVSSPTIYHNIYGGGANGSVGTYTYASEAADAAINGYTSGGTANIIITGGTIGIDGHENGMVFGSSRGEVGAPNAICDKLAWVYNTNVVIGTSGQATSQTAPDIKGSVYGGGENGHTYQNANVTVHGGTIGDPEEYDTYRGNVYGAGCGTDKYDTNSDNVGDTYNPLSGVVNGNTAVIIDGGQVANNVYGAGAMGSVRDTTSVTISGTAIIGDNINNGNADGNVYAAARGDIDLDPSQVANYATVGVSSLAISGGVIKSSAFGGGQAGIVKGAVSVTMPGGTVQHDVYGGGALAQTNTDYDASEHPAYTTTVNVSGGIITGDLYGGGLGQLPEYYTAEDTEVIAGTKNVGDVKVSAVEADVNGPVTVTVSNSKANRVFGCNNLNGAPKVSSVVTINSTAEVESGSAINSVYGGGNQAAYTGNTSVTVSGGTVDYVYGGGLGTPAVVTGNTAVVISGGTVSTNVYGGGSEAQVAGSTSVTISGNGLVSGDVYGGGNLADVTQNVSVSIDGGRILNDVYGGGALANTNTANWNPNGFEEVTGLITGVSPVTGLYTAQNDGAIITDADAKAAENTTYYQKGTWASGMNNANSAPATGTSTTYKTTVNLTGGIIGHLADGTANDYRGGNAYGGGLGRLASEGVTAVEAMVYGDIDVTVDGTAFIQRFVSPGTGQSPVPFSGRVFGCNNLNGTPKGNVTVTVLRTIPVSTTGNIASEHDENRFEIHSVYGGGNLSSYVPSSGKSLKVIIDGCEETLIEKVFGGGNSASVPSTDVVILGSLYIGYAFGGGNGADKIYKNGTWESNDGAPIYGNALIIAVGGKIGQVFSGSDTKGTVYGNATVKLKGKEGEEGDVGSYTSECDLKITNTYGAGRGADIAGNVNLIVSGCTTNDAIERVFGGSFDANIRGDVNLTITSGIYTQVFGGNDHGGTIGGNINVNIEETDNCNPTIIQYLYGGGREAAYPGAGAKNTSNEDVERGKITVSVKSATRIDNVFGGSYRAPVTGDTEVNINMVKGYWAENEKSIEFPDTYRGDQIPNVKSYTLDYRDVTSTLEEQDLDNGKQGSSLVGLYTRTALDTDPVTYEYTKITDQEARYTGSGTYYKMWMTGVVKNDIGTIGNVFGGSFESQITGTATVNIGTEKTIAILKRDAVGGNIIAVEDGLSIYDAEGKIREGITIATEPKTVLGAHITGNVYGGGDHAVIIGNTQVNICAKKKDDASGNYEIVTPGTSGVTIAGTDYTYGVFGGGNEGNVDGNSYVYLGAGSVMQSVYGGGCNADVTQNTQVKMLGGYVYDGVYGGGLMGSVGTFTRNTSTTEYGHSTHADCLGMPTDCTDGTGKCTVVINGGQVGPVEVALTNGGMRNTGNLPGFDGPVDVGFVFGAGRGKVENPAVDHDTHFRTYVNETDVTIGGTALIMASVYGGGENGRVLHDTKVTIEDGQIGCGEGSVTGTGTTSDPYVAVPYTTFINPTTTDVTDGVGGNALAECAYWEYKDSFLPYDPYANESFSMNDTYGPAANPATNGQTYYGCVFGGGSGYFPYEIKSGSTVTGYEWLKSAGVVYGNTQLIIKGGHILTNAYGGNETTDVKGTCYVTMSGGTLGVPRTVEQIRNHPQTCYLFGGGKGFPRKHFAGWTNVEHVVLNVTGGTIYGSVFGGAEDGHVLGHVKMTIGADDGTGPIIGTWGTSYVDGNVFGGGRGFSGESYTGGNVGGSVKLDIKGGTMLGSIYGGGRLGSIGYSLKDGLMKDDDKDDDGNSTDFFTKSYTDLDANPIGFKSGRGHVEIAISGGTIGNKHEYTYSPTAANTPLTSYDGDGKLLHTKGGNVFAGGMGRRMKLDGITPINLANDGIEWRRLGNVKSTKLTISNGSTIKSSVYGGGEFGAVTGSHTSDSKTVGTEIEISGGTIGSEIAAGARGGQNKYFFGNVFGGGYGTEAEASTNITDENILAALVSSNTSVKMTAGSVRGSVYGGGEVACVAGNADVSVSGGDIGSSEVVPMGKEAEPDGPYANQGYVMFGNWRMGNVFGSGLGSSNTIIAGLVKGNTNISISGSPHIYHNVYGGGALASVGTFTIVDGMPAAWTANTGTATINLTGGTIGISGRDNGMVCGSSRGDVAKPTGSPAVDVNDKLGWVNHSEVTVSGTAHIKGSLYGGGENGHNAGNSTVTLNGGTIGIIDPSDSWYSFTNPEIAEKAKTSRGNVYGAGCGTDSYEDDEHRERHNPMAGDVKGNATVTITGGNVSQCVYGAGSMGSVEGNAAVTVSGGRIGINGTNDGNVFGGPRGDSKDAITIAHVGGSSTVTIGYETTPDGDSDSNSDGVNDAQIITGSVFGGGEMGIVKGSVTVNMNGGLVQHKVYGGGALANTNTNNVTTGYGTASETIPSTATHTTTVNLSGGHVMEEAYGGALGQVSPLIEPKVYGDILVELNNNNNGGTADGTKAGCIVKRVFGSNDLKGTPKGHVKVHVHATQHAGTSKIVPDAGKYAKFDKLANYTITDFSALNTLATAVGINTAAAPYKTYADIVSGSGTETERKNALESLIELVADAKYDVLAVYGGGNLATYEPADDNEHTEVIIDGCDLTSIKQVYGGSNAASTPATYVRVNSAYEIHEVFGGGNGKDDYEQGGKYYQNPGANVGYYDMSHYDTETPQGTGGLADPYLAIENDGSGGYADATTMPARQANYPYGTGKASTEITGGRIHRAYGGSNEKGNIRVEAKSAYEESGSCEMLIDETYGGSKNAIIDAELRLQMACVDYMAQIFGGSTNSDVNSDITLDITNGTFGQVFGGNNTSGKVHGSITVNVKENGCKPIIIGGLYGGGYLADYSIYGYKPDGSVRTKAEYEALSASDKAAISVKADPRINVISATRIDSIFGGGYRAKMVGSPHINVNMEKGTLAAKYMNEDEATFQGDHEDPKTHHHWRGEGYGVLVEFEDGTTKNNGVLPIGTIGTIYGGGNEADIYGNTSVEIGTGKHHNESGELVDITRNAAFITGNVYGGGKMGHVGEFTLDGNGKPTSCVTGTGICKVTISNGDIGPDDMNMWHLDGSGNIRDNDKPDDSGHVFGAGQGTQDYAVVAASALKPSNWNSMTDAQKLAFVNTLAFADSTEVTIDGTAWVKGSVFGGGENAHVLHNTGVKIDGNCQIGNGHILLTDESGNITLNRGVNRRYTPAEWAAGHLTATAEDFSDEAVRTAVNNRFANSLPECDSWLYGKEISGGKIVESAHHSPYDIFEGSAGYDAKGGKRVAASGRTFNGNVYGGGSGYFPYEAGKWNPKAGQVEGNTWVEVKGGHIMTSLYGGNEMSTMMGDAHVKMSGGTVGVPRTLDEIDAHPVTCYVFGGGKGEGRELLDNNTDVQNTFVTINGGWVYGSAFGGAEDGHVQGNANVNVDGAIRADDDSYADAYAKAYAGTVTKIGTWGTSYVDGNIFGGGRGFDGINAKAGRIGGNVTINIKGGEMLGSVYGGGRLGSVGMAADGTFPADVENGATYGHIAINVSGGRIGNEHEYVFIDDDNEAGIATSAYRKSGFNDAVPFTLKIQEEAHPDDATMGLITEGETVNETVNYRRLYHSMGGSIYGGCMGRLTKLNGDVNPNWDKLGIARSTTINVSGSPVIKSSIFAGAEFGKVTGNTSVTLNGTPTIGTLVYKSPYNAPQYGFGSVYGGGYGSEYLLTDADKTAGATAEPREWAGIVEGETYVTINGGKVRANVYGGGKTAVVNGNTHVTITGGEVGLKKVRKSDGYVMYGSSHQGNVFGAGRGSLTDAKIAVVKGNTNINISGGEIYHMVYGGGSLASVGDFKLSDGAGHPTYIPLSGVPYGWNTEDDGETPNGKSTGLATVTITGGTIGISGRDNGLVFGSSRGNLKQPEADSNEGGKLVDPYDRVAWVRSSVVNIGSTSGSSDLSTPHIKGSVYGGGENGHNSENATVNVYSGTIGISDASDPWYGYTNKDIEKEAQTHRGNVYGAGSGSDFYTVTVGEGASAKTIKRYNPKSGMVAHNTEVNISGGHIGRSVYGGGSMAMVGTITNEADTVSTAKHASETSSFALSWPYKFEFAPNTGKATVNITGGHIGTRNIDGGDVYGSSRGEAGDRYAMAHYAYTRETEVNIDYTSTSEAAPSAILTDFTIPCITGSVHGSGENGYVYGDTHVTLNKGLVGHSIYGAGKGNGTYEVTLNKVVGSGTYNANIYSLLAGKVLGNTYVNMYGGRVIRNVYGGGNMGSVGKGNYASGTDDYAHDSSIGAAMGYGEKINGPLWESTAEHDDAWEFLNSGKTTVNVVGGTVGYIDSTDPNKSIKNSLPYGNVFGGSAGEPAPNIAENPRYLYSPAFFSGYVNETDVTIGGYRCIANCTDKNSKSHAVGEVMTEADLLTAFGGTDVLVDGKPSPDYWELVGPTILASVYGGGQDGHVRRDAYVKVRSGEIGLPFTNDNRALLKTNTVSLEEELDNPQWMHRGNVYGAGSGVTKYKYDIDQDKDTTEVIPYNNGIATVDFNENDYSSSAGSVTRFTRVDVDGGIIHRNVYGGGSMGSVGPPNMGQTYEPYKRGDTASGHGPGRQSFCTVNINGRIGTPTGFRTGWEFQKYYGGEVYGASRGLPELRPKEDEFSYTIWTQVNILKDAIVLGNVFGGGDSGVVKQDAEVNVGKAAAEP